MSLLEESQHLKVPFGEILSATNNFETFIGKGGFGEVYKGQLSLSGRVATVAVKRLNHEISGQGSKEFLMEIQLLSRFKHQNIIPLLGFCEEDTEKILVYEYAENGSLDMYLTGACSLTWMQRLRICIGAACGLDHLHNRIAEHYRVIHRDIKSANILLDQNWEAKISDLGLSRIGVANGNNSLLISNACGTFGYCDPVYATTGILTKESDVYSFGVVLFEVFCGRLCLLNSSEEKFLVSLVKEHYKSNTLVEIIDPSLREKTSSYSLNTFSAIAYKCLMKKQRQRPSMSVVLEKLEEAFELQAKYESSKDYVTEELRCGIFFDEAAGKPLADAIHYRNHGVAELLEKHGANPLMAPMHVKNAREVPEYEIDAKELDFTNSVEITKGTFALATWRGTQVAVKKLGDELFTDEDKVRAFRDELELLRKIRHPNVVQFLGAVTQSSPMMIVIEYLPKGDLRAFFKRQGALKPITALKYAMDIARGMSCLHENKPEPIIHGDLEPSNILRDDSGRLKVADFGVSELLKETNKTKQEKLMTYQDTNWRYVAPEVFINEECDTKVDVFSFALILQEMIEGCPPFSAKIESDVPKAYAAKERPPFNAPSRRYAQGLKELIEQCWHESPSKRPPFRQIIVRLESIYNSLA